MRERFAFGKGAPLLGWCKSDSDITSLRSGFLGLAKQNEGELKSMPRFRVEAHREAAEEGARKVTQRKKRRGDD